MTLHIRHLSAMLLGLALLLSGCTEESLIQRPATGQGLSELHFGFRDFEEIQVSTRVGLPEIAENRVINLYLMVFEPSGRIAYRQFFDRNNIVTDAAALAALEADEEGWWVTNQAGEGVHTHGGVKFKCKPMTGARVVLVANCESDILNITPDQLAHVRSLSDLQALKSTYRVQSLMRNGTMQMTGSTVVDIAADGALSVVGDPANDPTDTWGNLSGEVGGCVRLLRNDAKVTVRVGVVPGAPTTRTQVNGDGTTSQVTQVIDSFEPESWRVMNLPAEAWFMPRYDNSRYIMKSLIHSEEYEFESRTTERYPDAYNYDPADTDYQYPAMGPQDRAVDMFTFYTLESENTFGKVGTISYAGKSMKTEDAFNTFGKILQPDGTEVPMANPGPEWAAKQIALREYVTRSPSPSLVGKYSSANGTIVGLLEAQPGRSIWTFAPRQCPVLVLKGVVTMKHKENGETAPQTLSANVTYFIHLGDFSTDVDDYNTLRNNHYTYTVNIRGVNSIQLEVERDNNGAPWNKLNEQQAGATGRVYVAQEEIVTFDAHFGQRAYKFDAEALLRIGRINKLTWSVYTPFGRNGEPERVGVDSVEVANGLDYEWVHFMRNFKRTTTNDTDTYTELPDAAPANQVTVQDAGLELNTYSKLQRWYPGDQYKEADKINHPHYLMNVLDLCAWLRSEAKHYKEMKDRHAGHPDNPEFMQMVADSTAFDKNGEIWVTAFVDEFYYTRDPISHTQRHSLWHDFANQSNRAMHIMCDAYISRDGESQQVGTAVTLYQRAIQTIYNTTHATEGWGCETVDETPDASRKFYGTPQDVQKNGSSWYTGAALSTYGSSNDNGRYNTARILGITTGTEQLRWKDYMQYHIENKSEHMGDYGEMLESKAAMRYSWLRRNRDSNGDGIINPDEIRWYIASINQLKELMIGDQGITSGARLYDLGYQPNARSADYPTEWHWLWRSHVVSSTVTNRSGMHPQILWAEEGVSVSNYGWEWSKPGRLGIRCVRNLDETSTPRSITDPNDHPYSIIQVWREDTGNPPSNSDPAGTRYVFDLTRMNDRSKNLGITTEPLPLDENSAMSRPVNRFMTGPLQIAGPGFTGYSINSNNDGTKYQALQQALNVGTIISPEGYRTPTLREMLVIQSRLNGVNNFWTEAPKLGCANYYSFGHEAVGGNGFDVDGSNKGQSWSFAKDNITISENDVKIRTVRTLE